MLAAHERVLERCPDAQLVLVGYGPLEADLRHWVSARNIHGVTFAGHVALEKLPRYYAAADVFVLPSHEEVWGLVLNEAAASGLPLVTTQATGAAPDLVVPGVNGEISRGRPVRRSCARDSPRHRSIGRDGGRFAQARERQDLSAERASHWSRDSHGVQ